MNTIFPLTVHSDFALVHHVRDCYIHQQFQTFPTISENFPFWYNERHSEQLNYWTENHLAGILSSEYLIKIESKNSRLNKFLDTRQLYGFSEILSLTYLPITIASLLNLFDFSPSNNIRKKAHILLDTISEQIFHAVSPRDGSIGVVSTRMYSEYRTRTYNFTIHHWINFLLNRTMELTFNIHPSNNSKEIPFNYLDIFIASTSYKYNHQYNKNDTIIIKNSQIPIYEPIWIHWSYGRYFTDDIINSSIDFFIDYKIFKYHDFSMISSRTVFFYQLCNIFFTKLCKFILVNFFKISWVGRISDLSQSTIIIKRYFCNDEFLIISYFNDNHYRHSLPPAQQWPFIININGELIFSMYGPIINGPERELSTSATFPIITFSDMEIKLNYFTPYLFYFVQNRFNIQLSSLHEFKSNCFQISSHIKNRWNVIFKINIIPS